MIILLTLGQGPQLKEFPWERRLMRDSFIALTYNTSFYFVF